MTFPIDDIFFIFFGREKCCEVRAFCGVRVQESICCAAGVLGAAEDVKDGIVLVSRLIDPSRLCMIERFRCWNRCLRGSRIHVRSILDRNVRQEVTGKPVVNGGNEMRRWDHVTSCSEHPLDRVKFWSQLSYPMEWRLTWSFYFLVVSFPSTDSRKTRNVKLC